ncbi:type I-F CRISPR-associated helicase Cas3f [Fangia hongkongensis]|uniref:type I-F CRISPR-associated helicase Cas3f n=2 Tax=Fangia hongkongensis TaxID=270495 RepID=UPI000369A2B2|nr:type I-F CRISPR-associated helicase Cas3f [Fangia hongkongensis]
MMVIFVSECEKKALKRTRRVLDAFANRIGNNTWQTVITQEGLLAVQTLLRKTASKNTAVSCHWIRSRSRSQFLWVVGNKSKFNTEGVVAVNSTKKNPFDTYIESDWQYLPLIKALVALSALLHDWGKASELFQKKLAPTSKNKYKADPLRHEWVSILLLKALIGNNDNSDKAWLSCLSDGDIPENELKENIINEKKPLSQLPPAAKLIAWLIVSHHRLPQTKEDYRGEASATIDSLLNRITKEWGYCNNQYKQEDNRNENDCLKFPEGLLTKSRKWLKQLKRWAKNLSDMLPLIDSAMQDGSYRVILHHARLCLMLGDHYYSSQDAAKNWQGEIELYANSDRKTNEYKQRLDEHLLGVAENALRTAHLLPAFEQEPPVVKNTHELKKPSPNGYKWQDKATEEIHQWKQQVDINKVGFFAVNMASTGCGKTFANAKIMHTLSLDGESLRYILALGLRTLTLQTGDEYRKRVKLTKKELAVLIGSKAIAELHANNSSFDEDKSEEELGSESKESLLDEYVDYECDLPTDGLTTVLTTNKAKQFLYAPVLTCTIDHIIAATETKRGGRYILPSLRLMSSDLVIDEIDDFTGSDLVAIGRLIHLAGMLGRKVMISSATIPPHLAQGYFNAYQEGWQLYCLTRSSAKPFIGCAWIDENNTKISSLTHSQNKGSLIDYLDTHNQFIKKRVLKLSKQIARRKAEIIACPLNNAENLKNSIENRETKEREYFAKIKEALMLKHQQHHSIDRVTNKKVSFGVVRMANITPCVALTRYLLQEQYPKNIQIKAMAYHSQQALLLRHEQEKHLDTVLTRKEQSNEQPQAFSNALIREHLDSCVAQNVIFILVATPVEEVGRDHDFDWAIVEPSSYRSIVQLAGRVLRHRLKEIDAPNIGIMQYNFKAFQANDKTDCKYFIQPGYENGINKALSTHDLERLVDKQMLMHSITAIPRIQIPPVPKEQQLAALEHYVTKNILAQFNAKGPNTLQGYLTETWYLTALPQVLQPFRLSEKSQNLFLVYNENLSCCYFTEKDKWGEILSDINNNPVNREKILDISHATLSAEALQNLWLVRDYSNLLSQYIDVSGASLATRAAVSLRYGELNIVKRENTKYEYSDQLGLVEKKA